MNDNLFVSPISSSASSFVEIVASDDISLAGGGDEYVTPVTAMATTLTVATSYFMAVCRALIWFIQ